MFFDAQGRKWKFRVRHRDGTYRYTDQDPVLRDGESMSLGMMFADGEGAMGGKIMTDGSTVLADAARMFVDTYGEGAACLAGFSERVKAQYALGDAKSNEVYRVEQAAQNLRSLAMRASMRASGQGGGLIGDSAENSLQVAAFLTRAADQAFGRADHLRSGGRADPSMQFDARQQQRIADARAQGGDGAAAREAHKARLSNAWMGNR